MAKKLIGVTNLSLHVPSKQDVLLFDEIGVGGLEASISTMKIKDREIATDLDFLANQGIIFDAKYVITQETKNSLIEKQHTELVTTSALINVIIQQATNDHSLWDLFSQPDRIRRTIEKLITVPGIDVALVTDLVTGKINEFKLLQSKDPTLNFAKIARLFDQTATITTVRLLSLYLNKEPFIDAVPLVWIPKHGVLGNSKEKDVAELVIKKLPIPDDETPWEAILDFRQDPDARRRLFELRHWMNEARRMLMAGEVSHSELEEQLDYLIHEYTEYMKLQKMKINMTTLETIFTLTAGFAEDILKLKLKSMVENLFTLRHRKMALLEAERSAPGRQVAYLISASEEFIAH